MNKFLKLAAKIVAGLAILYILLVLFVLFFVHTDNYKPLITDAIYKATGRKVVMEGKMSLSIFPWPGITANKIIISNPKGFKAAKSTDYFAKIGALQIRLFMLPLIKGHIRPAKLLLSDATINLITSVSGKNNWSDLLGPKPTALKLESDQKKHDPDQKTFSDTTNADFPTLFFSNTNVHFINEQTKQETDLVNLGLRTKRIANGNKRLLEISCMIHRKNPEALIRFNTESTLTIDEAGHNYTFHKLRIATELMQFKKSVRPVTLELNGILKITKSNFDASFKGIIRQHSGNLNLNINRNQGLIRIMFNAKKLQIEPIISAFSGSTLAQGLLNMNTQLTTQGNSVNAWINHLSGKGTLQMTGGVMYGLDLSYTVGSALTSLLSEKKRAFAPKNTSKTSFSKLSANYLMQNGILSTNDLRIIGNQIKADGSGTINFPEETINLKLTALYTPASKWPIPIIITGNLYAPKIEPDTKAILQQFFKQKNGNGINKTIDKLKNFKLKQLFE